MKYCSKCGSEMQDDTMVCEKCGQFVTTVANEKEKDTPNKKGKLLGFRTGKPWKSVVSVLYLAVLAIFLFFVAILDFKTTEGVSDIGSKIMMFLVFATFGSPYIVLSDFKWRDKIPYFKNRTILSAFIEFVIIFVVIFLIIAAIIA